MKIKGVNYDVGRVLLGHLQRPTFDTKVVHRELEIIKNDLHYNAVKIQGYDKDPVVVKMLENLKFDPDFVSYSLVKSYADKHGTTYPDMLWEPKESFKAVADYYARQ